MSDRISILTDETFSHEVSSTTAPLLVDFWAPWCGPCRLVAPVLEDLAGQYEGRVKITKLNVDDNPRTASTFHITSIPTVLVFKGGELVEQIVGARPREYFQTVIEKHLG